MGFREKNAWICGLSILTVFAPYFYFVFQNPAAHTALFLVTAASLVLLQSGFHTINAMATKSIRESGECPGLDELDKLIELRASKWAGCVLAASVLIWFMAAMMNSPAEAMPEPLARQTNPRLSESVILIPVTNAMFWVQLLFAGFVLSNLVYYAKIVAAYRGLSHE